MSASPPKRDAAPPAPQPAQEGRPDSRSRRTHRQEACRQGKHREFSQLATPCLCFVIYEALPRGPRGCRPTTRVQAPRLRQQTACGCHRQARGSSLGCNEGSGPGRRQAALPSQGTRPLCGPWEEIHPTLHHPCGENCPRLHPEGRTEGPPPGLPGQAPGPFLSSAALPGQVRSLGIATRRRSQSFTQKRLEHENLPLQNRFLQAKHRTK